ncbi:unnamed protein product [Penicillium pancosmium]
MYHPSYLFPFVGGVLGIPFLCWVIYTLYFHPLAKYPGPFLAKFTTLYAAYHGWKGDIHLDIWACHQRYGDTIRYKPNSVIFNTVEALHLIYRRPGGIVKSKVYEPMVHRAPNTFTIRGGKEHAKRRRIMAQGLSDKALREYEPRIIKHIDKFLQVMIEDSTTSDVWCEPKNMAQWCNYLSFDIMADVVFGAKYNLLGEQRFRYVCDAIDASNVRMGTLVQAGRWGSLKIEKYLFRKAIFGRNRFVRFVTKLVQMRLSPTSVNDAADVPDVFHRLRDAKDPVTGAGFTLDEIAAESTTLIVAGSDTTSTSISAVLFYLAHHRDVYDKVTAEVRGKFSSVDEIRSGPALASCQFLQACVNEAFRMSPAVGSCLFREVVNNPITIDGQTVPTGYDVGVGIYSIHHSSKYFETPFDFDPNRWLEGNQQKDTKESLDRGLAVMNPFSLGTRSCLGKGLATVEIHLMLAFLFYNYDFRLADGALGRIGEGGPGEGMHRHRAHEYQLHDHITSQKEGPYLQFKIREQD